MQLGITTPAANEHELPRETADGTIKATKARDSDGDPRASNRCKPCKAPPTANEGKTASPVKLPKKKSTARAQPATPAAARNGNHRRGRVKKQLKDASKQQPNARVQPTTEFLKREADKLAAAACAVNSFLQPCRAASTGSKDKTTEQQPFLLTVSIDTCTTTALLRPQRERAGGGQGTNIRLTASYFQSLLGDARRAELE